MLILNNVIINLMPLIYLLQNSDTFQDTKIKKIQ